MTVTRADLTLSLQFADPTHRAELPRHKVSRWIRAALDAPGEITVRIVGAEEGQALNRDYRGKDYATNVLTFDYDYAPEMRIPLADHYAHLLVHGTLHAQGWDHEDNEADALAMEARETLILTGMGLADPYRPATAKRVKAAVQG
jgi:probable rRNA maturation factor